MKPSRKLWLWAGLTGVVILAGWSISRLVEAQSVISITTCQNITVPGTYSIDNDLSTSSGQACIDIQSSNVTIDGNHKNINVADGIYAVRILSDATSWSNIQASNFTSNGAVWVYHAASNVTMSGLVIGDYMVSGADHVSLTNSTINGTVSVVNLGTDNPTYITFTGNNVTGDSDRLAVFSGDGHTVGNCDTTGFTINGNTFIDTISISDNNPVNVFLSCTSNGSFDNNTVISTGEATGTLIRDGWSNNSFARNAIHVNQAVDDSRAAIALVPGSLGGAPNNNTFNDNTVIADNAKALFHYLQTTGNVFQNNVFVSNSSIGNSIVYTSSTTTRLIFSHNTIIEQGSGAGLDFGVDGITHVGLQNNIIVSASGNVLNNVGGDQTGLLTNHNLYQNRSGAAVFGGVGNFAAWLNDSGETNSMERDPLFIDYIARDYHLATGSPAIGAGTSGSDLGAIPYTGGTCNESWTCGAWGTCTNGFQTRTCSDVNTCGTTINRPPLVQSCAVIDTTPPATIADLQAR